ncbi:copper resistance protein CopC [Alteribacillus sp. JSM 102045]|uniref:copper resistance CopC family protein n=1 Tax=Alteribacillus sp. JSM 102045 TaxID=1562101 RepID=UPI0035C1B3C5
MKRIMICFLVGLFAFPISAGAHTHLERSEPEEGAVLGEETSTITLSFDSMVQEPNTVTLTDENGAEIDLEEVNHDPEDTIVIHLPEKLEDGDYTLFYSIVGEDGHVMEEELSYSYEGTDEESMNETEDSAAEEETDLEEGADSEEQEQTAQPQESDNNDNGILLPAAVGLIVIAVGFIIFLFRKKRT